MSVLYETIKVRNVHSLIIMKEVGNSMDYFCTEMCHMINVSHVKLTYFEQRSFKGVVNVYFLVPLVLDTPLTLSFCI